MRKYCLYCLATLATDQNQCDNCGHYSRIAERRRFWNRLPRLLWTQRVIAIAGFIAMFAAMRYIPVPTRRSHGILTVTSIMVYFIVLCTAAKLTRHMEHFRASIFWPVLLVSLGPALAFMVSPYWILASALGWAALRLCRAGEVWKAKIQAGNDDPCSDNALVENHAD
jgi:hypothetical protein